MEFEGALALFEQSQKKLGLTYKNYIGDGDSKSYATVSKAMPCGPLVHTVKEECVFLYNKANGNRIV